MKHTVHVNEVSNERRSEDALSLATVLEKFGGYEFDFELADVAILRFRWLRSEARTPRQRS